MGALLKEFDYEGYTRRIGLTYEDDLNEVLARKAIDWSAEIWEKLMSLGFPSPGRKSRRIYEMTVSIKTSLRSSGDYLNNHINIGPLNLTEGNDNGFRSTLIHEFFHAVQDANAVMYLGQAITEGSASLAPYLFDNNINQDSLKCGNEYLAYPGETMWDRPSPGTATSSRCSSALWWLYFTEQLSSPTDLNGRIYVLRDFFNSVGQSPSWEFNYSDDEVVGTGNITGIGTDSLVLKNQMGIGVVNLVPSDSGTVLKVPVGSRFGSGWKVRKGDQVMGVGDITGNGRSEIVLRSYKPDHIGIVGLDDDGNTTTVAVVGKGGRFGGGWKVRKGDQVIGLGDITGNGRSEIVLRSYKPDHIGIVGLDDDGNTTTVAVVGLGGRFGGGWKVRKRDQVVGLGDFTGNGRSEIVLRSYKPDHIGIVGLDDDGNTTTVAVVGEGGRFGGGWKVREGDQVVGVGDITGNGRSEIVLRSYKPDHIGIVGLDDDGNTSTVAVAGLGGRFGGGWKVRKGDQVVGLGDITGNGRSEIVLRSYKPDHIGIVGLDDEGNTTTVAVSSRTDGFGGFRDGTEVESLGTFTGEGYSQILTKNENDSFLRIINLDSQNQWKDRFTVVNNSKFGSLLTELDSFIRSRTRGQRTFETFWRDFAAANLLKDLVGVGSEHTYLQDTTVTNSVSLSETLAIGDSLENIAISRWASAYIRVQPSSQRLRLKLKGGQTETLQPIYWTVIVSGSNRLKRSTEYHGIGFVEELLLEANDKVTIIATTLYIDAKYSISAERV